MWKRSHSENSCAVKMNRLSAAGCQDIVSFGSQFDLNCVSTNTLLTLSNQ